MREILNYLLYVAYPSQPSEVWAPRFVSRTWYHGSATVGWSLRKSGRTLGSQRTQAASWRVNRLLALNQENSEYYIIYNNTNNNKNNNNNNNDDDDV